MAVSLPELIVAALVGTWLYEGMIALTRDPTRPKKEQTRLKV
jgi:hypothetical protein